MSKLFDRQRKFTITEWLRLGKHSKMIVVKDDGTEVDITSDELLSALDAGEHTKALTSATTLTAADSGKTIFLNSATGFATTLPSPADGLRFKFIVGATAPSSGNHTIVTASSANIIKGGLSGAEVDSTVDFDKSTADDTISFVASSAASGDWCELISDGTNWYVSGWSAVRAGLTLTQAS